MYDVCMMLTKFCVWCVLLSSRELGVQGWFHKTCPSLCENYLNREFFLAQIQENTDQKKFHIKTLFTECISPAVILSHSWLNVTFYQSCMLEVTSWEFKNFRVTYFKKKVLVTYYWQSWYDKDLLFVGTWISRNQKVSLPSLWNQSSS